MPIGYGVCFVIIGVVVRSPGHIEQGVLFAIRRSSVVAGKDLAETCRRKTPE
jgi:hypothetical protein